MDELHTPGDLDSHLGGGSGWPSPWEGVQVSHWGAKDWAVAASVGVVALTAIGLGSAHSTPTLLRWTGLVLLLALCTRAIVDALRMFAVRIIETARHDQRLHSPPPCPHCAAEATSHAHDDAATGTGGGGGADVARLR